MNCDRIDSERELTELCNTVKQYAHKGDFSECEKIICCGIGKFPHAPQPHNLMGVIFEMQGNHTDALKHFRAAWALDPTYLPARKNLNRFASFYSNQSYVFDENDLPKEEQK